MASSVFRGLPEEDAEEFLADVELQAFEKSKDESYKLQVMALKLRGKAKEWFDRDLPAADKATWEDFSEAFKKKYGASESIEDMVLCLTRLYQQASEDVDDFVKRYEVAWEKASTALGAQPFSAFMKRNQFVTLLHSSIRDEVDDEEFDTYEQAVQVAKQNWKKKQKRDVNVKRR